MEEYDDEEYDEGQEEEDYVWEGDEDGEGEYDDGNGEDYAEGDENHVISAVVGRKVEKGVEYFKVSWDGGAETSWETKEVIAEYGGIHELKKFQAGRETQPKQTGKTPTDRTLEKKREKEKKLAYEREQHKAALISELSSEPPVPTYDLRKAEDLTTPVAPAAEPKERSRVRTLKFLATKAFAASVLLYEELSDFPTSLKAPVFSVLLKESQLTASHLKVLLSTDQKRLDLSPAPSIIGEAHIEAIAERCHQLEYLDLKNCSGIKKVSALASGCQNLTYLDVSRAPTAANSLDDIVKACGHLRVLKAADSGLTSFVSASGRHQKFLEELDVSNNPNLPASQVLSRLIPGRCPNLRILRANAVFTLCTSDAADRLFAEFSGELVTATFGKANTVARCPLEELHVFQKPQYNQCWISDTKMLDAIFKCIETPQKLRVLDLSTSIPSAKARTPSFPSRFSRVVAEVVNKAGELTPSVETLLLRNFSLPWRYEFEPQLPASVRRLDLNGHTLRQEQLAAMIMPPTGSNATRPFPRFSFLDIGSPEFCVQVEPTMMFQLFRNGHHPWETLKIRNLGDEATNPHVLNGLNSAHINLQVQPFLKKLDISSMRWLPSDLFQKVVHKNVLPNLESLAFSISGNLLAAHVDNWLKSSGRPPKLAKLKIVSVATGLFQTHDLIDTSITHLVARQAIQSSVGLFNIVRTFPKLQYLSLVGCRAAVDALVSELGDADHPLPELDLCCPLINSHRVFFTSIKNSNVRNLSICEHAVRDINRQISSEKSVKEMLVARGDLPPSAIAECDVFPGVHRVKCIVKRCRANPNPYFCPYSYWI
eukprot:TRINITY_DN15245_c0_g1_i1.p1 TRINITY_DN15245_c0_g1~~TRINITY_DN15245_c0_g1_i1.p1  ORF type:complete len:824 (-),score=137.51 TRINITY_DN15245_c0_g1_i1:3-2474(-)